MFPSTKTLILQMFLSKYFLGWLYGWCNLAAAHGKSLLESNSGQAVFRFLTLVCSSTHILLAHLSFKQNEKHFLGLLCYNTEKYEI